MKSTIVMTLLCASTSLVAGVVDNTTYSWVSGEHPESAYDGKVKFTYTGDGRLEKIRVEEFPDASKKLTFTGDAMSFTNANNRVQIVPGEVVFANEVTGTTFFCECIYGTSDINKTYGGGNTFLTTNVWKTALADASLDDWDVSRSATVMSSSGVTDTTHWSNPNNEMYAHAVKRTDNAMTLQYQTASTLSGDMWFSKCVKVELRQNGANIEARAVKSYYVKSPKTAKIDHGYDVDELIRNPIDGVIVHESLLFVMDGDSTSEYHYGVNIMKFVRTTPLSTVRFTSAYGSRQIATLSPQQYVNVILDDASTMNANGSVYPRTHGRLSLRDGSLYWNGLANGGDGDICFESVSDDVGAAATVDPLEPALLFTTTERKVAENRRLRDLAVCTNRSLIVWANGKYPGTKYDDSRLDADKNFSWGEVNGSNMGDKETATSTPKHDRHPGNLYNLKFTDETCNEATAQVQCQQGTSLRCFFLRLYQRGNDIYAKANGDYAAYYINATNEANKNASWYTNKIIGVDFDLINAKSKAEKDKYGWSIVATATNNDYTAISGIGFRAFTLVFKKPTTHVIKSVKPCKINGGNYIVQGRDDLPMTLEINDPGGFPTNGTVKVRAGGELWLTHTRGDNGILKGVSKGTCALVIEKGGIVRQMGSSNYPFGEKQAITNDGGTISFEGTTSGDEDCGTYFNQVTLMNGAKLVCPSDRGVRLGNSSSANLIWKICGSSPSTNSVAVRPLGPASGTSTWCLDVADTGDFEADYVTDGEIRYYGITSEVDEARIRRIKIAKQGAGTMLLNGNNSHIGLFTVRDGKLVLGESSIWSGNAPIAIEGGASFAAKAGTSNETLGALTVGSGGASIVLGEGSTMTFANSQASTWADSVYVSMPTNSTGEATATLRFTDGVTGAQLRKLRVNGKRADITADGQIIPFNRGFIMVIR